MNTANIGGRAAAIYGVGPTATPERVGNRAASAFVSGVRDWFLSADPGTFGGTYGVSGFYVVGGYADAVVIRAAATTGQAIGSAVAFVEANPPRDGHGYGWWLDTATGRVWLDVVRTFDDYADAVDAAVANGEKAICRLSDGQSIDVATSANIPRS